MDGRAGDSARLVVDRVEGAFAAVELPGRGVVDLPVDWLPVGAKEGDVLRLSISDTPEGARRLELALDQDDTRATREDAAARLQRLRERDPGGDLEL